MKKKRSIYMLPREIKFFITFISILFSVKEVTACDMCGCYMGITPYDNQSQIYLLHRYRNFNGYREYHQKSMLFSPGAYKVAHGSHDTISGQYTRTYSSKDFESYKTYELRLKYFIHKRVELNAIVPFNHNKSKEDTLINESYGIGDPNFFAGYHLIRRIDEPVIQQRLIAGAGFKLPSGNYYAKNDYGNRIPLLLQPGTGSVDYFVYLNYILGYKKIGLSTNLMYKLNGKNYYNEKISNSFSSYINLFMKFKIKEVFIIPNLQTYYEYTEGLTRDNVFIPGTKMNSLLSGIGIDLNYKGIGLNLGWQGCVFEESQPGNLKNAGRIMVGLSYSFKQTKYLLDKKIKSK